jgi:RimJ/RimL family protein N-acetyltransferase
MRLRSRPIVLPDDAAVVLGFHKDAFRASYGSLDRMTDDAVYLAWLGERLREFPQGYRIFEDEGGRPVGQLEMRPRDFDDGRFGYVNLYYLVPKLRGSRLGKQLHDEAMALCRREGCSRFRLKVARENTRALAFYRKLGCRHIGDEHEGRVRLLQGLVPPVALALARTSSA